MNIAILLAGGIGNRMKEQSVPKQYISVQECPVFIYPALTFQKNPFIDCIIIVADTSWHGFIDQYLESYQISKFRGYALPGKTRQYSIFNGLNLAEKYATENDIVIIHDAARPLVSDKIINECIETAGKYGASMPVLPMKDTVYLSNDQRKITQLLNRNEVYAGQAPEAFRLKEYLSIHKSIPYQEIEKFSGSSEIAFLNNIEVHFVDGDEMNFKITTNEDLEKFRTLLGMREENVGL